MADCVVGAQVHALVFNAPPEPLDKHVVTPRTPTVHRELRASFKHRIGELARSELAALISVDDFRCAEFRKGLFDDLDGVTRFKCRGRLVREHPAAGHINHRREIDETLRHRDVGRIQRPDLIGTRDRCVAQQVRVDRNTSSE